MSSSVSIFLLVISPVVAAFLACLGYRSAQTNLLGWLLLLIGLSYIIGGILYYKIARGKMHPVREERGDKSFWLIQPGFFLGIFGAPLEYLYLPKLLPRGLGIQIAGLLLVTCAIVLTGLARKAIRGLYSGHLQIQPDHHLVMSGPYRYIRHPAYLGYLLLVLGIGIGYSSVVSSVAIFLILLPGIAYRINVEETLLVDEFGDDYLLYAQKTRRLVPGLW